MAAEKTRAVVLRVLPYRESSLLLHLFSERHGLVHGIAKGIRTPKSPARSLERGLLIEVIVYVKPHRDLHTLANAQLLECFPATRADLLRTALRDIALETFLATVTATEPHPEIFSCLAALLRGLEADADRRQSFARLWAFFLDFASLLGFALHFDSCVVCRTAIPAHGAGGTLSHRDGGVVCERCRTADATAADYLPPWALVNLRRQGAADGPPSPAEALRVTRALARYCRYHFGIESEFRSLRFLEDVAASF